jgi:hypothetical protein
MPVTGLFQAAALDRFPLFNCSTPDAARMQPILSVHAMSRVTESVQHSVHALMRCRLKDPPAFQRFCASIKPPAGQPGSTSTAARHQAALSMKQQAAEAQARREVAELQAAEQ